MAHPPPPPSSTPHWTVCSLAVLLESCGFMTSGSSGGLEKLSIWRASNISSGAERAREDTDHVRNRLMVGEAYCM